MAYPSAMSLVTGHWSLVCSLLFSDVVRCCFSFSFAPRRRAGDEPAGRPKFDLNVVGGVRGGGRRRAVRD